MAHQKANLVVVEYGADAAQALSTHQPEGDINHVLCCGPEESLAAFAERVLHRLGTLRRNTTVGRVVYVFGQDAARFWGARHSLLKRLLLLLKAGAKLELMCTPSPQFDLLQAMDSLMPFLRAGVNVRVAHPPEPAELGEMDFHDEEAEQGIEESVRYAPISIRKAPPPPERSGVHYLADPSLEGIDEQLSKAVPA